MFSTLNKHISQIIITLNPDTTLPITQQHIKDFTYNAPAYLMHEKVMHEIHELNKERIFIQTLPNSRHILPSLLNSKIPTTLLKLWRQIKENRIKNEDFTLSFRRSHRMYIIKKRHAIIKCKCGTKIDTYGDHFFCCTHHSKTKLHNHIRNTIHFIVQNIETHANFIKLKEVCQKEATGIIPTYPTIRPGDITIHPLKKNDQQNNKISSKNNSH